MIELGGLLEYVLFVGLLGAVAVMALRKYLSPREEVKSGVKVELRSSDDIVDWLLAIDDIEDFGEQRREIKKLKEAAALNQQQRLEAFSKGTLSNNVVNFLHVKHRQ